jgi:hypothetical protein
VVVPDVERVGEKLGGILELLLQGADYSEIVVGVRAGAVRIDGPQQTMCCAT